MQKFLSGAFDLPALGALVLFALLIVAYTAIGGFRGSVYADSIQAVFRLIGTIIALGAVISSALADLPSFESNIASAGEGFSTLLPGNTWTAFLAFVIGFACAGLGFGLGQPQLVSRYLAGRDPKETRSAWWIYIGFVQFTWIAMTLFGVLLRGVMPDLPDPEAGLSVFFADNMGSLVAGIIIADIFATIAATSNSLLVAMAQAVTHDLLPRNFARRARSLWTTLSVLALGGATMAVSFMLAGAQTVFDLAISAVSLMGAGLAAPVMIKVLGWRRSSMSLLLSIIAGLLAAIAWKYSGVGAQLNEAAIGILVGLGVNWVVAINSEDASTSISTHAARDY